MAPPTEPLPLAGDALLAFLVPLARREQQAKAGATSLPPPFADCPACQQKVTEVTIAHRPVHFNVHIHVQPCGHLFRVTDEDGYHAAQQAQQLVGKDLEAPWTPR